MSDKNFYKININKTFGAKDHGILPTPFVTAHAVGSVSGAL